MIIGIIGSRTKSKDQQDMVLEKVREVFKYINRSKDIVISGGCASGADAASLKVSGELGIQYLVAVAHWNPRSSFGRANSFDKNAGFKRNSTIAQVCDKLVAFWDGKSSGTLDTIYKVQNLGKPVWVVQI